MKKVLAVALICFAAIGCNKGEAPEPSGRYLFEATTEWVAGDEPGTRSYFPGESGLLYWSASDNLGVYSFKSGSYLHSGFCKIESESAHTNEGKFTSQDYEKKSDWFDGSISGGNNYFCSYYPVTSSPATYSTSVNGVLLDIPSEQTGDFGKHHICSSKKVEVQEEDLTKDRHIRFAFSPLTALLRVRLVLTKDSDFDEVTIKQLSVTNQKAVLCGGCKLTFPTGEADNGTLTPNGGAPGHSVIVNLSNPVTITKDATKNPYINIVLLPTEESAVEDTKNSVLSFMAKLPDNTPLTIAGKTFPTNGLNNYEGNGLEPGKRYDLDREITVKFSSSTPDASYVDGGYAWDNTVIEDGTYKDGGFAW